MGVSRNRPVTLSTGRAPQSAGAQASLSWLSDRGIHTPSLKRWHVEVSMTPAASTPALQFDERVDTRFHIDVYAEEWGFFFCHHGRASWIRVTDIPFVHGKDDFRLLAQTPALRDLGALLRTIENQHELAFARKHALVRTNLTGSEAIIRQWIESL